MPVVLFLLFWSFSHTLKIFFCLLPIVNSQLNQQMALLTKKKLPKWNTIQVRFKGELKASNSGMVAQAV